MAQDLMRFSVAMPEDLLFRFDELVARRGLAKNRSEVVRDLVRDALVEDASGIPGTEVIGLLSTTFDYRSSDLLERMHAVKQDYYECIVSSSQVHLEPPMCMEIVVLRGETGLVQDVANRIIGLKGVKTGKLSLTTVGHLF